MKQAAPESNGRYKDQPLSLAVEFGLQRYMQFALDWISPPATPANAYGDYLKRHRREGIHHIGLRVPDVEKAVATYRKLGYTERQSGETESAKYALMDTDKAGGVCVKLVQAR